MLKTLRDLFETLRPAPPEADPMAQEHALQLATAVMLVEVMRADTSFEPSERAVVRRALGEKFQLAEDEAARLAELAEATAKDATDLYAFTSHINERFDMARKIRMIEAHVAGGLRRRPAERARAARALAHRRPAARAPGRLCACAHAGAAAGGRGAASARSTP